MLMHLVQRDVEFRQASRRSQRRNNVNEKSAASPWGVSMATISILTTTYNRERLLPRLFESLCNQTCKDFEWIVVDDGSCDNTRTIIESWRIHAAFSIVYYYHDNKGTPTSRNVGYKLASGDYCFTLDSDDEITPNAIEIMKKRVNEVEKLPDSERIGVMEFMYVSDRGLLVGKPFSESGKTYKLKEQVYINKNKSDKMKLLKRAVYMEYKYMDTPRRYSSCALDTFWFPISEKYLFVGFNDILGINHQNHLDRVSLTSSSNYFKYAAGYLAVSERAYETDFEKYAKYAPKRFVYHAVSIAALNLYLKKSPLRYMRVLTGRKRMFYLCCIPLGFVRLLKLRLSSLRRKRMARK